MIHPSSIVSSSSSIFSSFFSLGSLATSDAARRAVRPGCISLPRASVPWSGAQALDHGSLTSPVPERSLPEEGCAGGGDVPSSGERSRHRATGRVCRRRTRFFAFLLLSPIPLLLLPLLVSPHLISTSSSEIPNDNGKVTSANPGGAPGRGRSVSERGLGG